VRDREQVELIPQCPS